jgi:hypothetical protein
LTAHNGLEDLDSVIADVCTNLDEAIEAARNTECDVAILNANLDDDDATPVWAIFHDRKIPFIVSTDYGRSGVPQQFSTVRFSKDRSVTPTSKRNCYWQ